MLKKFIGLLLCLTLAGCAVIEIPSYVKDVNPYKNKVYASFDDALVAVHATLELYGWKVEGSTEPSVFENDGYADVQYRSVLLYTNIRRTSLFVASRFARINVIVRELAANETEVEIRYRTINSILFKKFTSYKKDPAVQRMLQSIEEQLNQPPLE